MSDASAPPWLQVGKVDDEGEPEDLRIDVLIAPRASRTRIMGVHDDRLKIQIAAPPSDGKANDALVKFIATTLGVAKAQVEIVSGASNPRKTVRLLGVTEHLALIKLTPPSPDI